MSISVGPSVIGQRDATSLELGVVVVCTLAKSQRRPLRMNHFIFNSVLCIVPSLIVVWTCVVSSGLGKATGGGHTYVFRAFLLGRWPCILKGQCWFMAFISTWI